MNRRERRAARARGANPTGKDLATDEEYIHVIESIANTYIAGVALYPDEIPRFAFPPKSIFVIGDLAPVIPRIARNDAARAFLNGLVEGARRTGDPKSFPTVFMVRIALEHAGAPIEEVSCAEWGIAIGGRGN